MKSISDLSKKSSFTLLALCSVFAGTACGGAGDVAIDEEWGEHTQALAQSLVPVLTGPTPSQGAVLRSGAYSAQYEAWQAFDADVNSMWISAVYETPAWIGYSFDDGPRRVTRYAIHFVNGSLTTRAPKDWTLEGWNGSVWVVIDRRQNETDWRGVERREYAVATPGAYSKYRISVTDDNDVRSGVVVVSMGRLELLAEDAPTPAAEVHPVDWYMRKVGLPMPSEIGQTKIVEGACDVRAQRGAAGRERTATCTWQQTQPGWQIVSADLEVLENRNNRGSWSQAVIAENGQFTASSKELGDKWKAALDLAAAFNDFEAKTKLEIERQRHTETFYSYVSNKNTFFLTVTANPSVFRSSAVRVKANVKLIRIL